MVEGGDVFSYQTLSIMTTVISATGGLSWWLSTQFNKLQNFFIKKIDDHEDKDNKRFDELSDDLWVMRVRLAAANVNGDPVSPRKRHNARNARSDPE